MDYLSEPYLVLDVNTVSNALRGVVCSALQLAEDHVLVEGRVQPRPTDTTAYVTILWLEQELLNQFDGTYIPSAEQEYLSNDAYCSVRFTVRGKAAYNLASELRYAIERGDRNWDLYNMIGFGGAGPVVDMSAAFGGKVQQRAHFDMSFYVPFGRTYTLAWFKKCGFIVDKTLTIYPKGVI